MDILRNIAEYHHETLDEQDYLRELRGDSVPVKSRIVVVANVFDALTGDRPYEEAWIIDESFKEIRTLAGGKLDPNCVDALIRNLVRLEEIMGRFKEDSYG